MMEFNMMMKQKIVLANDFLSTILAAVKRRTFFFKVN